MAGRLPRLCHEILERRQTSRQDTGGCPGTLGTPMAIFATPAQGNSRNAAQVYAPPLPLQRQTLGSSQERPRIAANVCQEAQGLVTTERGPYPGARSTGLR